MPAAHDAAIAFSHADEAAYAERAARLTTILLVGRLEIGGVDYLCRVRNVSSGGMLVECDAPVAVGDDVTIELRNLNVTTARVVWRKGERMGVQFDAAHEVQALLHAPPARRRQQPRSPRLSASCAVVLWSSARPVSAVLLDLSQTGCRLALDDAPPVGSDVRVAIPGLGQRRGTLRWTNGREAGLVFCEHLPFGDFVAWQSDAALRFKQSRDV